MSVPNVMVVQGSTQLGSGVAPLTIAFPNGIPNLKKNRAFYLTFADAMQQMEFRVHHIVKCEEVDEHQMRFTLGNSFVAVRQPLPEYPLVPRGYAYYPLTAFDLQQIAPGTLIKLIRTPAKGDAA